MGTAITLTKVGGPIIERGLGVKYVFSGACDTTDATGIQTMDLTSYFSYVYDIQVGSNDTLADNGRKAQGVAPGRTTAVTSTNCAVSFHQSAGAASAMAAVTSTDLSAIGALMITVIGKPAAITSWS